MKKYKALGTIAALTLGAGALLSGMPAPAAFADESEGTIPEPETSSVVSLTAEKENAELLLPARYEEYLPLENPAYAAMNDEHIAIADGSFIYIYDRKSTQEYSVYQHLVGDTQEAVSVSKIQFTDDGRLYFRDNYANLYEYDFETNSPSIVSSISCLTFLIHGEYMYMAHASPTSGKVNFTFVPVDDMRLGAVRPLLDNSEELSANNPLIAYENDTLYCIINDNTVNAYQFDRSANTHRYIKGYTLDTKQAQIANLQFVCAYGDEFFYTVKGNADKSKNGLYRTDLEGNAKRIVAGDDFSSITSYQGKLYCVQGRTIKEMTVTTDGVRYTGYEIASASSSRNRIDSATEIARAREHVVICDRGNKRVLVYHKGDETDETTYTPIPCVDQYGNPYEPEHIAINKEENTVKKSGDVITINKLAVSSGKNIYYYTLSHHSIKHEEDGAVLTEARAATREIAGLNFVYGECYYITKGNGYGTFSSLSTDEETEPNYFDFSGTAEQYANRIASDIYGNIYVAFGNRIYIFTEADFTKKNATGEEHLLLSENASPVYESFTVDYEGNVWHISHDGTLYCENEEVATIDGKDFVYLNEDHDYPVSFALGFVDDEVYFNFSNYVVKTKPRALQSLVALNKIEAGQAKEKAFALADAQKLFVAVPKNSVGIEIDLSALKTDGSEYFPYASYSRTEAAQQGVLLYEPQEEDGYYVVALYHGETGTFHANLFKKSIHDITFMKDRFEAAETTAYATSDVALSSAPCLFTPPAGERLSPLADILLRRGTKMRVWGYAAGTDRDYAYVEILDGENATEKGYIPRSYLTLNDPSGITNKEFILGHLRGDMGTVLVSSNGEELLITERTEAKLYLNDDGNYTAVVEKDGIIYSNTVGADAISKGETDALRVSLIVILSALALVIVAGYIYLMFPKHKKN